MREGRRDLAHDILRARMIVCLTPMPEATYRAAMVAVADWAAGRSYPASDLRDLLRELGLIPDPDSKWKPLPRTSQ